MPGLVPGIHVLPCRDNKDVDGRDKPGHDGENESTLPLLPPQPHPRRVAIGELDAGLFQHALDRREIVFGGIAAALHSAGAGLAE
jgi:hypothetical protein